MNTRGEWDRFLTFFAAGLQAAATSTRTEMLALVEIQRELHEVVRASAPRADTALAVVDFAVANPSFTVRRLQEALDVGYGRADKLAGQLVELGVLKVIDPNAYSRRFFAPRVIETLTRRED